MRSDKSASILLLPLNNYAHRSSYHYFLFRISLHARRVLGTGQGELLSFADQAKPGHGFHEKKGKNCLKIWHKVPLIIK